VWAVNVLPNVIRIALLAAFVLALSAPAAWSAADPPRVLFVGNSLTSTNDLPRMVADLASRTGAPIEYEVRAPGGVALEDHWNQTDIREVIANGRWDFVVMQQGPSSLPESAENLRMWAGTFADAVRAQGGRPALYTVWPESYRKYALDAVISSYRRAAVDSQSLLLPVGLAWKNVWKTNPRFPLYGPDGFHPSKSGTYLAAVVIYSGLTGRPAVGLPRVLDSITVSPRTARITQRAAAAALRG
jgi:hypothetical protein